LEDFNPTALKALLMGLKNLMSDTSTVVGFKSNAPTYNPDPCLNKQVKFEETQFL
jgi:hypothetical protein